MALKEPQSIEIGKENGFSIVDEAGNVIKELPTAHSIDFSELKGKNVLLLIDADILAYRASATCDGREYTVRNDSGTIVYNCKYKKDAVKFVDELGADGDGCTIDQTFTPEPVANAIGNLKKIVKKIKSTFNLAEATTVDWEFYLTPESNFRSEVQSDYKANRKDVRKPTHLQAIKDTLRDTYGALEYPGYEADDILGIRCTEEISKGDMVPVIVSIDKDLDTIPGYHYKWTTNDFYYTTERDACNFFYLQLLTGDATDNIKGITGVGPKTAAKILAETDGRPENMYRRVLKEYLDKTPRLISGDTGGSAGVSETDEEFFTRVIQMVTRNARLLYILRAWEYVWQPPISKED